jgi:nitronate monooxygenase
LPETLPYPLQHVLTQHIRKAAAEQLRSEWMSMWAGQGIRLARQQSAQELVKRLTEETDSIIRILKLYGVNKLNKQK